MLFIPLPILYNIVIKDNWKKSLLLSFEISVILELTQYIFRIGALDINLYIFIINKFYRNLTSVGLI